MVSVTFAHCGEKAAADTSTFAGSLPVDAQKIWRPLSILERHAPSEIARTVKSITAREMWEQHESYLEEYLWGGGFWEQSYYIGTAGQVSIETIEQYIERTEHV